ncbi:SAM-dependent methyltransferase [Polyangium aurulentum]|uniref:SAM-dependent methyltransferase n=1 Tax=Polyangium aurulentum TaxID=2567896 RepID=UPI0010AE7D27|nr:class I SAM-dependent methyltransferase [Polyangium aurulentum]UQA57552.1 class I SAM-dependent methyltransferase [Polyangium aurulentum]
MVAPAPDPLVTDRAAFRARFPLPDDMEARYGLPGKSAFVEAFVGARDKVEAAYYEIADRQTTPNERARKFLGAMLNPVLGKPMRDPEQFYQTFGRLMRRAWLSCSVGMYGDDVQRVATEAERLILAQVNTVDINWRPAVSRIARAGGRGLIVEVGTGRGNSVARLATLLPEARIVSLTISPEQHDIVKGIVEEMGLSNVEIRRADIFDPAATADLVGEADAVGAIEVVLHFPTARKLEGMRLMTRLLKPGAPLCIVDTMMTAPLGALAERYYANQCIYFGQREQYFDLFAQADLTPAAYVDYTPDLYQTFRETTHVLRRFRGDLREEFGWVMSLLWPEVPGTVYIQTLKNVRYVHAVGLKN